MLKLRRSGPGSLMLSALLALAWLTPLAPAQSIDQKSIDRAHDFLKSSNRGKGVLSFVHFGAEYKGHTFKETRNVQNKPGHFALVYQYNWESDGVTKLAFLCDSDGKIYSVQVLSTNAFLQQPYALANTSITVIGNLILEAFRDQMSKEDVQQVRQFVDNPNARGLLEMSLKLQQTFGQR